MNISPIATNKTNTNVLKLGVDKEIKLLEKRKMQLQEQIKNINDTKLDDKTKKEKIEQLQEQIGQIDMQIQQIHRNKQRQNQKKNQNEQQSSKSQAITSNNEDSSNIAGMSSLIAASSTYSKAKIINNVKNDINAKVNILKIEIELDDSRRGASKAKREEVKEIELKGQALEKKLGEINQDIQNKIKESKEETEKEKTDDSVQNNNDNSYTKIDIRI